MQFDVLGCGGSGPSPDGGPASGYLVRTAATALWMDAGTGTFMELCRHLDPARIDGIVISHTHADHCADLLGFFHYIAYRTHLDRAVPLFLPPGARDQFAAFLGAGPDHPFHTVLDIEEVSDGDERILGDLTLRFATSAHSVPTNAIRIESGGRSIVYSGDTGPGGGFPGLACDADLMVCETGLAGQRPHVDYAFHMSGAEAGAAAATAGVGRLILTHMAPNLPAAAIVADAAAVFDGPIEAAVPRLRINL